MFSLDFSIKAKNKRPRNKSKQADFYFIWKSYLTDKFFFNKNRASDSDVIDSSRKLYPFEMLRVHRRFQNTIS